MILAIARPQPPPEKKNSGTGTGIGVLAFPAGFLYFGGAAFRSDPCPLCRQVLFYFFYDLRRRRRGTVSTMTPRQCWNVCDCKQKLNQFSSSFHQLSAGCQASKGGTISFHLQTVHTKQATSKKGRDALAPSSLTVAAANGLAQPCWNWIGTVR